MNATRRSPLLLLLAGLFSIGGIYSLFTSDDGSAISLIIGASVLLSGAEIAHAVSKHGETVENTGPPRVEKRIGGGDREL